RPHLCDRDRSLMSGIVTTGPRRLRRGNGLGTHGTKEDGMIRGPPIWTLSNRVGGNVVTVTGLGSMIRVTQVWSRHRKARKFLCHASWMTATFEVPSLQTDAVPYEPNGMRETGAMNQGSSKILSILYPIIPKFLMPRFVVTRQYILGKIISILYLIIPKISVVRNIPGKIVRILYLIIPKIAILQYIRGKIVSILYLIIPKIIVRQYIPGKIVSILYLIIPKIHRALVVVPCSRVMVVRWFREHLVMVEGHMKHLGSMSQTTRAAVGVKEVPVICESWKDYWRAVEFWLASEGVNLPPAVRSSRLMQQLKERAAKIVNHLAVEDVACDDGVNIIKREMEKSPIIRLLEHKEVDRKRQKFMRLARLPGESLESFINRASIYRHENDQCQNYKVGSKFYLGHLLDAAKLTRKDEALVKTAAGGLNDETKVVNALLELADQLEGMPGFAIGRGEPDMPDEDEYLVQKRRQDKPERERPGRGRWEPRPHRHDRSRSHKDKRTGRFKKWKQVFHAMLREESDGSSSSSGSLSEESEGPTGLLEDGDEEESPSSREDPSEGHAAPAEVFAQEYKARRKVNEPKKMRQYFQKGSNQERTQAWVKEQQKREPCFLCQKLGHWSQECPLRKKGGSKSHPVHVTAGPMRTDPDQWSLLEAIAEYTADVPRVSSEHVCCVTSTIESSLMDHEIFWSMRELSSSLILDLGCMKSVAGTKWVNQHIQRLKELGRWMKAVPENESFRFGDGHELRSSYSFMFEATLMGVQVIIRLSVVPGERLLMYLILQYLCILKQPVDVVYHFVYRYIEAPARTAEHHRLNTDGSGDEAFSQALHESFSDWSRIEPEKEKDSPVRAKPGSLRASLARDRRAARSKSADKARSKSSERQVRVKKADKGLNSKAVPTPRGAPPSRSSRASAPSTPARMEAWTVDRLKAQAAELETRLWNHMDPTSIDTPGSKKTKAYWVQRVTDLEEEWENCQREPMETEELEEKGLVKVSSSGEDDSPTPTMPKRATRRESPSRAMVRVDPKASEMLEATRVETRGRASTEPPEEEKITKTRAAKGKGAMKVHALTDHVAPFPSLSNKFSDDVVINLMLSLQKQLFAFKWKTFVWMLRVKKAIRNEFGPEARWQLCNDPKIAHLHLPRPSQLEMAGWLALAASWQYGLVMMEVFHSGTPWHRPGEERRWKVEGPLWDHIAPPSFKDCSKMMEQLRQVRPNVLIIGPPRGPWSSWLQEKEKMKDDLKARYWPMWNMIEEMWHYQQAHGRLVLLQVPARMMPPGPDEMRQLRHIYFDKHPSAEKVTVKEEGGERTPCYATRVDLCQWGAVDPSTQKPYKRACRVEVNDPWWCSQLAGGSLCQHGPGAHQEVSGCTKDEAGNSVSRAVRAQQWPSPWAQKVLDSSQETLELRKGPPTHCVWHQECADGAEWEAVPVEVEPSPEGQLRQQLGEATGDQYDYIYFEGASGALSRQVRSTLAKLHVVLGHVTNDKLKRMLHLNGAKQHLLDAAGDLRCQVCQKVTAPKPPPRVSYERPQRFNQRVVTDVFYVWDANNTKYAVVHALDAFALYQVATLMPTARADLVAHFLKNYWLAVFGPPEVLMSDAGSEYAAATESLLRAYDVYHEVVPPGTKWRMGLAERHGAVLKLLVMKTIHATTARGHSETKECVVAATAARNRQMRISGFSPVQIVLGKDVTVSSSLLEQIERGHFRYVLNQDLVFDEARRRNEQIRQAAEHAFVWMNGHETLRKALNAKSRHPRMEMLYEGAQVYFYEPPSSRKGLPRRLQDQISWMGPAVVAAIERREGNIRRVWVRYRTKLKGVPLEYIRLAALEEVEATKVCQDALKEVEKELEGGRPDVDEMLDDGPRDPEELPDIFEFSGDEEPRVEQPVASVLDDVPAQLHRDRRASFGTPLQPRKKVRFDEGVRATEEHLSRMRAVLAPQEPQERARMSAAGAASSSAAPSPAPPAHASHRGAGVLHVQRMWRLDGAVRGQRKMLREAKQHGWTVYVAKVESVTHEVAKEVANFSAAAPETAVKIDMPVTGKPRLEYKWGALSDEWKRAFVEPLKKAVDVYVDNDALEPVPLGPPVPPEKILPSRFVLTNKSDKESLEEACLKARWVLAGHLDKEAGQHATEAPTASLVAHNIVCFLSAQMRWKMRYADISAAFLQGEYLDEDRVVFVKLPRGYPDEVREHLGERLKAKARGSIRLDLVRLTKGGFGLSESPRLWYLRLKRGLHEIGLRELKLSPGTFVFHVGGALRGVLSIHVDDLRIAFHPDEEKILDKLQGVFRFGDWKEATQETVKFCGRWEKQCPETFQIIVTMSGYVPKLKEAPNRPKDDRSPLTEVERKWVSSVGGQLLWMARQGRADLAFGISRVQQLAGAKDPTTIASLNQLVTKAREPYEMIFQQVPGKIEDLVFLAVSDASHGSMPKGRSQGGMMILLANNEILEGPSLVNCVLYHSAVLKRVVRSSLAAEISQAAETMDQCEYVRAMFAEIWDAAFSLPQWRWSSSMWPQILVLDSRTGYDVLNSISNGEDKRLAIDIAILKESLYEPDSNRWVRWVPGLTMPSDGLTKQYGNDTRDRVMQGGPWCDKGTLFSADMAQRLQSGLVSKYASSSDAAFAIP
ncbi:RE2, partial [Symbiodinium necroappetens]